MFQDLVTSEFRHAFEIKACSIVVRGIGMLASRINVVACLNLDTRIQKATSQSARTAEKIHRRDVPSDIFDFGWKGRLKATIQGHSHYIF